MLNNPYYTPLPNEFAAHSLNVIGGEISVFVAGSGKPLVFLNKLGGSAREWSSVAAELARDHQVFVVELPGHGQSRMEGNAPLLTTHAALAGQLSQVLDMLGLTDEILLVGCSVGGSLALAFAALFPERVSAVVSLGASWTDGTDLAAIQKAADEQLGKDFDENGKAIQRSMSDLAAFGLADQDQTDALNESRANAGPWVWPIARSVAFDDFSPFFECLNRSDCPIAFAYGEHGHYGEDARKGVDLIQRAKLVEIAGASAFPHEDRPQQVIDLIRAAATA